MNPSTIAELQAPVRLAVILSILTLQGCSNFYEKVADDAWREVGLNEPPVSHLKGDFQITPIRAGQGPVVRAGDLVYVRLSQATPTPALNSIIPRWAHNAWIWTGRRATYDPAQENIGKWGDLGSSRLRAALIGMAVGQRFQVQLEASAEGKLITIPLYGITPAAIDAQYNRDGDLFPAVEPPGSRGMGPPPPMLIEILETCPGHYFQRSATLEQWGYPLNMFDSHYPVARSGQLGWSALQGDCPPPRGKVRFELGPLFSEPHQLLDWDISYRRAHRSNLGLHISPFIGLVIFAGAYWIARRRASQRRIDR